MTHSHWLSPLGIALLLLPSISQGQTGRREPDTSTFTREFMPGHWLRAHGDTIWATSIKATEMDVFRGDTVWQAIGNSPHAWRFEYLMTGDSVTLLAHWDSTGRLLPPERAISPILFAKYFRVLRAGPATMRQFEPLGPQPAKRDSASVDARRTVRPFAG